MDGAHAARFLDLLQKEITQAYWKNPYGDFKVLMRGIYSESVNDFTSDESLMAYKSAEEIIATIVDTVTIDRIIHPIFNFKA